MTLWFRLLLACPLVLAQAAQSPQTPAAPPAPAEDLVFRVTVNLVQVDAVVTDSEGKLVTDLTADDFEIDQDGRPQKIAHASFIPIAPEQTGKAAQTLAVARPQDGGAPHPPPLPARLRPEQARRTMAVVVDDLGLSFQSMARVRSALTTLVDTQMQPGDLVTILRTGGSMGAFSQFTGDERILHAAIDRIRWNALGRSGIDSVPAVGEWWRQIPDADPERRKWLLVGTLEAIRYIVDGMRELPGRKSVVLFSDSMSIHSRGPDSNSDGIDLHVLDKLQALTDSAHRAFVVIYSIDPRGLETLQFTAEDNPQISSRSVPEPMAGMYRLRSQLFRESKEGLRYLARETGGFFVENENDIQGGIRRVLEDQKGYYLIGYSPDASTFDAKTGKPKFRKVSVKVKRPRLTVRSRHGFLGTPDPDRRPAPPATREAQLAAAARSPFTTGAIRTRLTALFSNTANDARPPAQTDAGAVRKGKSKSFINTIVQIDGKDLTFVDETDPRDGSAWKKAVVDVLLITFGDHGQAVGSSGQTFTFQVRGAALQDALENGFVNNMEHPVREPGAYQLRAVVRDAASGRTGSASQFIEVPDFEKGELLLSGVTLRAEDQRVEPVQQQPRPNPQAAVAQRVFRRGESLAYAYVVMNPRIDSASKLPRLESRTTLYRDGKQVYQGKPAEVDATGQSDLRRIAARERLQLGSDMVPGDYVLQVAVTDKLRTGQRKTATQTIDFEVAR